ncbi:MAG: glycosyltransferase family 39 protein [candidate division WOR-3 bacterium]|nr:glycosyltransferase family 39 protein [candidate division WOR-3 bacterium]MCX7947388.1 glycosyltransferase family 39 protein [candidate division WOR-3 bacterium]MDW8150056.1 glycosyltransferase family 39 protein [candidate division WOR-3 bacterium]
MNSILAYFLKLAPDEAYYWVWSNYLSFGYFDHPPMVALLIKIGHTIFKSEFGVRFATLLLSSLTIYFVYRISNVKNFILFFLLIFSNLLLNAGGFIAVPDTFLVFFSSVYFYFLKRYIEKENFSSIFLLSISISLMLYSKYHGILIILFTLFALPKLFLRKSFYMVFLLSLIFYMPHIIWLFQNNFITIKYQLLYRQGIDFNLYNVFDYIIGQFLVYGPIVGFITIISGFLYKPKDDFEKVLKYNLIGIFLFFLVFSFRNKIEANWTSSLLVPLFILSYNYIVQNEKIKKLFYKLATLNTILIFLVRLHTIYPIININNDPTSQFRNWKEFAIKVRKKTGNSKICATNYQLTSELWFYLKEKVGFINIHSRENQYSLWKFSIDCKYIVSHVKTSNVIDSLIAPYLGKVYIISKMDH